MPLGPQAVSFAFSKLDSVFKAIDEKIADPRYMSDNVQGTVTKPYWEFCFGGELNAFEKQDVIDAYFKAGWSDVQVLNSSENNEMPGMCLITLHK